MEFVQLRYFLKIAEVGSFTKASRELMVSQPALSRSIGKIEEELGQPVFERQSRSVVLTEAGRTLHQRALQIVQMLEEIPREIRDDGVTGTIRIGAIPTIAPYWLPEFLLETRRQFPDARIHVREDITERLLQSCNHGEIDLAIVSLPMELGYLDSTILFEEELKVALPAQHSLARQSTLQSRDLSEEPLIMLGEGHCLSEQIDAYCRRRSIQPVTLDRAMQLATVLELVACGHGISFIPEMACVADKRRVYRSMVNPIPKRKVAVVWNPYRFESKLQKAIRFQTQAIKS